MSSNPFKRLVMVVATTPDHKIGFENHLPWHKLQADMKHFQKLTCGQESCNAVVMGRKTFQSLPSALPKRLNIVLSRNQNARAQYNIPADVKLAASFEDVEALVRDCNTCFVIGGAEAYQAAFQSTF